MSPRRLKLTLLLTGLALSSLVFLGWTQAWFFIALDDGPTLNVAGDVAAAALAVLALTCVVLSGALSIAGPVFRVILGVLEALLGIAVVFSGVLALADPVKASTASISDATGLAGAESVAAAVASLSITAWPWVATIAGAALVLLGVLVAATAQRWPTSSRKYSAVRLASEGRDAIGDWDSLSNGDDPT